MARGPRVDFPGSLHQIGWIDWGTIRQRKADPEAELRDREAEARRYRELAARWPRTAVLDARQPPEAVLSAALVAAAWAVGVAP